MTCLAIVLAGAGLSAVAPLLIVATLIGALETFFRRHPGVWHDGRVLSGVAGCYAWRTRTSELRRTKRMVIKNRQRRVTRPGGGSYVVSEYAFFPKDLIEAAEGAAPCPHGSKVTEADVLTREVLQQRAVKLAHACELFGSRDTTSKADRPVLRAHRQRMNFTQRRDKPRPPTAVPTDRRGQDSPEKQISGCRIGETVRTSDFPVYGLGKLPDPYAEKTESTAVPTDGAPEKSLRDEEQPTC